MGQTVIKSSGVTDIKALLSQVKPVPTSELANKVIFTLFFDRFLIY